MQSGELKVTAKGSTLKWKGTVVPKGDDSLSVSSRRSSVFSLVSRRKSAAKASALHLICCTDDALNEARSWSIIIGGVLIAAANGAALTLMPTLLVALYLEDPEAEGGAPSPLGEARTAFGALYGLMSIAPALGQLALFNGLTVAEFEANKGALWCSGEAGCYTTTMAVELALSVLATLAALELARCAVGRHIPALLRTAATSGAADRAVM